MTDRIDTIYSYGKIEEDERFYRWLISYAIKHHGTTPYVFSNLILDPGITPVQWLSDSNEKFFDVCLINAWLVKGDKTIKRLEEVLP
jgi:hypothetical protein